MSKHKHACYHCLVVQQAKLFQDNGYSREYIFEHMLAGLADFLINTSEVDGRIDTVAELVRKVLTGMLHERVLAAQTPSGHA